MARYVDREKSQNKFIIITTGSSKAKCFFENLPKSKKYLNLYPKYD